MNRYYCPYCSPHHQIQIQSKDGILICGHCGDPLVKNRIFKLNRLISLIVAVTFMSPFLLLIISIIINNLDKNTPEQNKSSLAIVINGKKQSI